VFEAVRELKPLGVGINLQPNAVRELFDLGIGAEALDRVGLPAREWALVGLNGNDIYAEPRGLEAGLQLAAIRGAPRASCTCCSTTRWSTGRARCGAARARGSRAMRRNGTAV
jgi:hypothetical protein